ncbi:hypothetical protein Agabi119p4_4269 [Agaricus bisporus var. burnettii]|uniref:Polynucleotide 5'-hydroxyl-kinase GRC3 n=1 Tax=Agaricus bisporus var. burnettii TaxID=192524 RepID=A0A8H7KH42_AGABI|nr:hypothetical protein Agabi119p4_4269 [Agaricus bisporus var. burnettii]
MISAVAARKTAQATLQKQQGIIPDVPSSSPGGPPPSNPSPNLPLKRKPSPRHSKTSSSTKKRKRGNKKNAAHTIDLESDVFQSQREVIVIESDDDEDRQLISQVPSDASQDDSDIEILPGPPTLSSKRRAWSPSMPLDDSSSSDEAEIDMSELIDLPARFSRLPPIDVGATLSTFVPTPGKNVYHFSDADLAVLGEKGTIVVLEQGESLCVLGTCRLTLLKGAISLNGVPLQPSLNSHRVFSPRSSPLVMIEGQTGTKSAIDISSLPPSLHCYKQLKSALVFLQELQTAVEGLGRICRTFEGVFDSYGRQDDSISSPFQLPGLYLVQKQARDLVPFSMPPTWSETISTFSTPPTSTLPSSRAGPTYLVKGPKKCGKSTFARTLLNTLLSHYSRVAYLECDIGQSEFTPPGIVALNVVSNPLFGPAYTHLTFPVRSHFIGSTTPKASPTAYLEGVRNLYEFWRIEIANAYVGDDDPDGRVVDTVPLIVNTMGWIKGLGADLMRQIEEMVEPSEIFEFQSDEPGFTYGDQNHTAFSDTPNAGGYELVPRKLEPAPSSVLSTSFTPADQRTISIISYFHAIFPSLSKRRNSYPNFDSQSCIQSWDVSLPLCAIAPYEVDVGVAFDQVILTGPGSEDVVFEEVGRVLNGALVGFIQLDHHQYQGKEDKSAGIPYVQARPPPSASESSCIGLGLIRGTSTTTVTTTSPNMILHILTPVPPPLLANARLLVKGEMELPIWGMLDFRDTGGGVAGVEQGRVPYLQWGRVPEGVVGGDKRRVRRNLMRRGQA